MDGWTDGWISESSVKHSSQDDSFQAKDSLISTSYIFSSEILEVYGAKRNIRKMTS